MPGGRNEAARRGDAAQSALDFVHGLLCQPLPAAGLDRLLADLTAAFAGSGAGWAALPSGKVVHRRPAADAPLPWNNDPSLVDRIQRQPTALVVARPGADLLVTAVRRPGRPSGLLWLEADAQRGAWSPAEAGALALAGQAIGRLLEAGTKTRWAEQMDRAERQQGLEAVANVVARLAHDYGNILTGIVGFCDLSLALRSPPDSQLSRYLRELQRCAQNGAQLTHLLRLFARRQAGGVHPCEVGGIVAEEAARVGAPGGPFTVSTTIGPNLPLVAVDAGQLRQVLAVLLENARDAMQAAGGATVSVRTVQLTDEDCLDLFGDARPGSYVELTVADAGPGLSGEASRRLFAEPFFSAKPRRRGFGLAVAYGIVHAHHGGLRLRPGASGGTVAEVYVPLAAPATAAVAGAPAHKENILVVDDDPNILRMICATLERAGYQAQPAGSAEEALTRFTAGPDRFRLVLSDVIMPKMTGVDLARRLLALDPEVRVLFMSGQATSDFPGLDLPGSRFEFLSKPFRPEGLLQAVRGAIDRGAAGCKPEVRSPKSEVRTLRSSP